MTTTIAKFDTLNANDQYVFTYASGNFWKDSASWVQQQLTYFLQNFGDVVNVDRGFISGHYAIVVAPNTEYTRADWETGFKYAFQSQFMDWPSASLVLCEAGTVSSQPGGIKQEIVSDVKGIAGTLGDMASGGLGALLKPLAPYFIAVAAGWLLYEYTKSHFREKSS
jgi:hypothetical protein